MNDDFFESFNSYNSKKETTEPVQKAEPVEPNHIPDEPLTTLLGQQPRTPAAPAAPVNDESLTQLLGHQPMPASQPAAPSAPAAPADPQTNVYNPYVQPQHPSVPVYTNPYATENYPARDDVRSTTPSAPAQPVYHSADVDPNRTTGNYGEDGFYHRSFTKHEEPERHENRPERKKEKSGISKGAVAAILILCLLISGAAGFGGSILASKLNLTGSNYTTDGDALVIHKVEAKEVSADSTTVDKSTAEITEEVANSVVEITTEVVQTSDFYGQYIVQGAGSGVIISEDGTIITNNHVIEGAKDITVTLRSGESFPAELVGADEELDIALIKIDPADTKLTVAVMGDSSQLKVGDKSVIIGNPLGTLGGSVTEGIISALDRSIVVEGKTMNLMQTDAAINAGNSGGGMFNGQGELVGIVVAKNYSGEVDNIGFVIPINSAMSILGDLKQYGYVRGKADTGMTFVDLSNPLYSWYYYGTTEAGCYVNSVEAGSNAEQAGFRKGDRILSINGEKVSSSSDIKDVISGKSVGDQVEFEVERGGRTGTLTLTLEEKIPDSAR